MTQSSVASDVVEGQDIVGITAAGTTDPGLIRERNEDSYHLAADLGVAVVSDGMGGAPAGEVASALAVDRVASLLCEAVQNGMAAGGTVGAREIVADAIVAAHNEIREDGHRHPERMGMGATVTAAVIDPTTGAVTVGHIGDSRAYLLRGGVLTQLTRDDTLLQEQVEQGRVSAERAKKHPFGHILSQVLGMEQPIQPQVLESALEMGDQLLLCSDGVTAVLSDAELAEMLERGGPWPVESVLTSLVEAVNERGGPDNATAILLRRT